MSNVRTPIGQFIHTSWANMNVRCGKYTHLQTKKKCKTYAGISIEFTRREYKEWCIERENKILILKRPSIDRKDKTKNYSIDNIQIIELSANIRKDKTIFDETHGTCYSCLERKKLHLFAKDNRRQNGRSTICKLCDNRRKLE